MNIFLERYADEILISSLGLKSGDVLSINTEECNSEFAHILAKKAREITGNGCYIQLIENGKVVATEEAATDFPIEKKPTALLHLPTYKEYEEIEDEKIYEAPKLQSFRLLSEPLFNPSPSIPFSSAPSPNKAWGKSLDDEGTASLASSLISDLLSLGEDDYLERTKSLKEILRYERDKLNKLELAQGRITTEEGTDLSFKFLDGSEFAITETSTSNGRLFTPTIFSSDIFRALNKTSLNGYLNITRPIMLFGKMITNLSVTFENGSIVDFSSDERSARLFSLYLKQDREAGKASMLSIAEETNPASFIEYFSFPEWDRMRTTSIVLGGPRPEGIKEEVKSETVDSLVYLYLPIGSDSMIIEASDNKGEEFTIVEDGILQEEE